jgi:hypothetical protein
MCRKCDDLQKQIEKFQRFLSQPIDGVTTERLKAAVAEMKAKKAGFHSEQE